MGNRGKGLSKGKGGKNGKGKKGKKGGGGGASKWGDEGAARDDEQQGHPVKKKRRLTQEAQDRRRRMKIMELNRTKDREQRRRLSQPNTADPAEVLVTKPKKRKRKKRPRGDKPPAAAGRDALYYSSSDDDNVAGGTEEETEEEAKGGFDAGLASYKKLLSALEAGGGGEDKDLAAAVVARRMQREGRDGSYGSGSSSGSDDGEGEEDGEEEEEADDGDSGDSGREGEGVDEEENGDAEEREHGDNGEENRNGGTPNGRSSVDVESESDIGDDDSSDDGKGAGGGKRAAGRSKDEFCRHFVSTSVFPPEKAAELSSNRGRPSFKPLSSSAARSKWDAAGLTAVASQKAAKQEEEDGGGIVPPPLPKGGSVSSELGVLPSLERGWEACNDGAPASKLQSLLLPALTGYRDMLYCGWRDEEAEEIRRCYALHALNHALTSRRRVVRHTARLRKAAEETRVAEALARAAKKEASSGAGDDAEQDGNGGGTGGQDQSRKKRGSGEGSETPVVGSKGGSSSIGNGAASGGAAAAAAASSKKATVDSESDDWQRDQGFTRPKVLILLPFRGLAHELVEIMIELLGPKTVTVNKGRFDEEYGPDDHDEEGGGIEGAEADGTKRGNARAERAKAVLERKPGDWKALLGEGRNVDDMFTLGISLSPGGGKGKPGEGKGVGVRLYCDFYNSDIIVASPVALHRASVPGDGGEADGSGSGVDSDFLSSVEVCILDRADVFLMQNWSYVPDIAEVLNSRPTGERASRADFSRVRPLFLHEQGRLFRQTLVFSAFQDPNLNALASRHLRNHDGVVKVSRPSGDGHICEVALQAKQVFQRVPCESLVTQDDSRFEYFVGTVLPQVLRAKQTHTAVFIPSYFDYVRVRNHLMKTKASVVNVHEYSRGSEVARSRARFFRGDRDLLLYTGRAHFFNRYCIRGIHHLIFYSLPECPQFYPEMVNLLEEAESVTAVTCLSLFTRFERLSLERIVGEERAGHMLASAKNTFLFC